MTFCKSRYNKKYTWELSRFCNKKNLTVVGGFSKLLKAFRDKFNGSIISYADRCISFGDVYSKNGFQLLKINPPGYKYVNLSKGEIRMHRMNFTKIKLGISNQAISEKEYMYNNGYNMIFDCGTFTYILE